MELREQQILKHWLEQLEIADRIRANAIREITKIIIGLEIQKEDIKNG